MPRFKIHIGFGFAGCEIEDEIEAESEDDANQYAWEEATQRIEVWSELIEEEPDTDTPRAETAQTGE